MNVIKTINRLPWKYVAGINGSLVALAIIFTSIATLDTTTEHRSQAKEVLPSPLLTVNVNPQNPPQLQNPDPTWAKVGDAILVKGKNLGTTPFGTLQIGEVYVPHDHLIAWEPNQIVFIVPEGAKTAVVSINTVTTEGEALILTSTNELTITTSNQN